jgi:hypothetical protein
MPVETIGVDAKDQLLAALREFHLDVETRRDHHALSGPVQDVVVTDATAGATAQGNLQEIEPLQLARLDADMSAMAMVDQRYFAQTAAADADIQLLLSPKYRQIVRLEQRGDMSPRCVEIVGAERTKLRKLSYCGH